MTASTSATVRGPEIETRDLEQHPLEIPRHPGRNEQAAGQTEHREHRALPHDERHDLAGIRAKSHAPASISVRDSLTKLI
jgi:hypothetical protein